MRRVTFLLVVVLLLLVNSVVAAQPNGVLLTSKEEFVQQTESGVYVDKKWVEVSKPYTPGQSVPSSIMYDSGGYTGILYFQGGFVFEDGFLAEYAGWVYGGNVQPWGLTHIK